jgi:hypothetical protein
MLWISTHSPELFIVLSDNERFWRIATILQHDIAFEQTIHQSDVYSWPVD